MLRPLRNGWWIGLRHANGRTDEPGLGKQLQMGYSRNSLRGIILRGIVGVWTMAQMDLPHKGDWKASLQAYKISTRCSTNLWTMELCEHTEARGFV